MRGSTRAARRGSCSSICIMRIATIVFSLVVFAGIAVAGKKSGVTMPDTSTVAGKHLVLNGMGLREATWLGIDVYVAGLYLEAPTNDGEKIIASNQVKVLVLRFVRDVGRKDIVKAWTEGFQNNATVPLAKIQTSIDQLNAWMPKFDDGDTLIFTAVPGKGVEVIVNGVRKGTIEGEDFSHSLFAIWLGAHPPTKDLKRGLLGN
jgi:hypothetical protein